MFNRRLRFIIALVAAIAAATFSASAAQLTASGTSVPGEAIVKFAVHASNADVRDAEVQGDIDQDDHLATVSSGTIRKVRSRSKSTADLIAALSKHTAVAYVEPNYILRLDATPNDPSYGQLWGLKNTGQVIGGVAGTPGADIKAEAAWDVTKGSASIVVGVVDTGIDYTHPDLTANVWNNPGGVGGCAAGTHGYNAITKTCDPADDHYHGTHCAGTIGAVGNNAAGVPGVNWTTSIMGLKFLDSSGSGTTADAIAAIDFAVNAKIAGVNVRVLSNSWGGGAFSQALMDEINKANTNDILFVAAAGNASSNNDVTANYPSNYATANMVAVAATDNRDGLASFSNYGATTVHLGAPGVDIYSLQPGNLYQFLSGTSMATPHVAGVAALVLSAPGNSAMTTAQLKTQILTNVDPIPSLAGKTTTGGRLNAAKAVGPGTPCVPPAAPAGLTATGGQGQASLSWGAVTGATEYHVLRSSTTGGPYTQVGVSTTTTFTNTGLAAGTYYYVVRSFLTCESANSNEASAVVTAPPTPPDFSLSVSPSSLSVPRKSGSGSYTVTITRTGGFTGAVTFSVSGLPSGSTGTFNPNPASAASSTLTITTTAATRGTFALTITGTSGTLSHTASATLVVTK